MPEFFYGPANKTIHTKTLELLTKVMLYKPEAVSMKVQTYGNQSFITANVGDLKLNVSDIMKQCNFHHLTLNKQDSSHYYNQGMASKEAYRGTTSPYQALTKAEQSAIENFTSSHGCNEINNLLYGNLNQVSNLKDAFLDAMMMSSGLNKIAPDLDQKMTYRGESSTSEAEIQARIALVEEQMYSQETAFKSTTTDDFIAECFAGNNCLLKIMNSSGKDISELSLFPSEEEYVLNVEKLQWLSHETINGMHVFTVQVINPLDDIRDAIFEGDAELLQALEQKAEEFGLYQLSDSNFEESPVNEYDHLNFPTTVQDAIEFGDIFEHSDVELDLDALIPNVGEAILEAFNVIITPIATGFEEFINPPPATGELDFETHLIPILGF